MERRELLKVFAGAPIVAAIPTGASAPTVSSDVLVLDPVAVKADLAIHDDAHGATFALTLMARPWPKAGQRIALRFQAFYLRGVVRSVDLQPIAVAGRVMCHVTGDAEEYDAAGVKEHQLCPLGWVCPICQECYRPGQIVQRMCCLREAERAVPVLDAWTKQGA